MTNEQRTAFIKQALEMATERIAKLEAIVKAAQAVDAANEAMSDNSYNEMDWIGYEAVSLHDILLDGLHVLNEALLKGKQP